MLWIPVASFSAASKLRGFGNKLNIEGEQEKKVVDDAEVSGWEDWVAG